MMWFVIISIVVGVLIAFLKDLNKDNKELNNQSISEKFKVIADEFNRNAFAGLADIRIHPNDKRSFHLYKEDSSQIIVFEYGTGILVITWRYKYMGEKEIVYKRTISDARNISLGEQKRIARQMNSEMNKRIDTKMNETWGYNPNQQDDNRDVMKSFDNVKDEYSELIGLFEKLSSEVIIHRVSFEEIKLNHKMEKFSDNKNHYGMAIAFDRPGQVFTSLDVFDIIKVSPTRLKIEYIRKTYNKIPAMKAILPQFMSYEFEFSTTLNQQEIFSETLKKINKIFSEKYNFADEHFIKSIKYDITSNEDEDEDEGDVLYNRHKVSNNNDDLYDLPF